MVTTSPLAKNYEWYFEEKLILSTDDATLEGCSTDNLVIGKCLPKHRGSYKCVVTDELGENYTTRSATLNIGRYSHTRVHVCMHTHTAHTHTRTRTHTRALHDTYLPSLWLQSLIRLP